MESMTGYAFIESSTRQFSYSTSIKSLNSRYLEIYSNLPKILKDDEVSIESILKNELGRGKIELTIEIYEWAEPRNVSINFDLIKKYYKEIIKIEKSLNIKNSFDLNLIFSMDGVMQRERTLIHEATRRHIYKNIKRAVNKVKEMRLKEGNSIKRDLKKSINAISGDLVVISNLTGNLSKQIYERLKNAIESLSKNKIDDYRIYNEIAILADKLDINEEKIRLRDHIEKFNNILNEEGQIGKQLDFLAQEMFREINTISNKANNSKISHIAVDMKNNVDKIREHCRNIV